MKFTLRNPLSLLLSNTCHAPATRLPRACHAGSSTEAGSWAPAWSSYNPVFFFFSILSCAGYIFLDSIQTVALTLFICYLFLKHFKAGYLNCKGPQTNMPQNVGSIEDLICKNIQSRNIEFCKADRTTWKLTFQYINTMSCWGLAKLIFT